MTSDITEAGMYGVILQRKKIEYAVLYDLHCGHDCDVEGCRKWEVDQIQDRYNFILEMTGEYY